MARSESRRYVCAACGAWSLRWEGQCRSCGGWNTLVEREQGSRGSAVARAARTAPSVATLTAAEGQREAVRAPTGLHELDRVLGGGLVAGSVVLLGGEPGIGKSTLVLAICASLADGMSGGRVLYVSGEESATQLRLRANRLGVADGAAAGRISILTETSLDRVLAAVDATEPELLVVDSIQTIAADELEGQAGSVSHVRAAAAALQAHAKQAAVPLILVGHVTKDGTLAGPKTLEHLVDVVLSLEGERFSGLRLLRAIKNRFGSTEEVGLFEMAPEGLRQLADPGAAFLQPASLSAPGVAVAATLEGSRPVLVEVQALVAPQVHGSPRRTATGLDAQRIALLIAVLGRRAGVNLASHDVYASVVGGFSVEEPAIDLPLALAMASSLRDRPLLAQTVCCAEVGLTGELRPIVGLDRRLREAARLGFQQAIVPRPTAERDASVAASGGMRIVGVSTLREALAAALVPPEPGRAPGHEPAMLGSPTA
ncbi:MAG: DNA repair protein RadA [Chloroflexota bacterium]|nr:DNA repair protein RadA [Chloroflexota bacterium]